MTRKTQLVAGVTSWEEVQSDQEEEPYRPNEVLSSREPRKLEHERANELPEHSPECP